LDDINYPVSLWYSRLRVIGYTVRATVGYGYGGNIFNPTHPGDRATLAAAACANSSASGYRDPYRPTFANPFGHPFTPAHRHQYAGLHPYAQPLAHSHPSPADPTAHYFNQRC
jgi:hypothetical protein